MTAPPNPPAFPRAASKTSAAGRVEAADAQDGMLLRDYFAGQALATLLGRPELPSPAVVAELAYHYADALLAERRKGGGA